MAQRRVLILDDCQIDSIIKEHSWSELIDDDDDIELYILTSTGALSQKDKACSHVRAYKEIDHPTTDGTLELWAHEMHKKHSFTHIYTKNEDLMLRTAHVRTLLNITNGLTAETVPAYREKVRMKEIASKGGFPVPPFARLGRQTHSRLLSILPTPADGLVFHLELYENLDENRLPDDDFVLCEIAARAPGASITHLIDLLSFRSDNKQSFAWLDFRVSVSLPISPLVGEGEEKVVTDLIIPRKPGKLMYIPRECPIHDLTYIPLADVEKPTVYEKYDINGMNTVCRFLAQTKTMEEGQALVEKGVEWFESVFINTPLDEPCTMALIKELHRYFHRKIFV